MSFNPHRAKIESVTVEFNSAVRPGERERKTFPSNGAARRFYLKTAAAGRNPRVTAGTASR